ncbi:hypothetical protein KBD45_03015 [Candidatus Dojkabacteria bacterium]|nr:hypothetical protein [Candidatus Dojkabacteria bacterium]
MEPIQAENPVNAPQAPNVPRPSDIPQASNEVVVEDTSRGKDNHIVLKIFLVISAVVILCIVVLALMFGLIIFNLNPAQRLRDSYQAKYRSDSYAIESAIRLYTTDNRGVPPFEQPLDQMKVYTICESIKEVGCDLSLQVLVTGGYIQLIPTNDCAFGSQSGYELKLNSENEIEVSAVQECRDRK